METDRDIQYLTLSKFDSAEDAKNQGYRVPGWYFWDETGAYCHGPFMGYQDARTALKDYVDRL